MNGWTLRDLNTKPLKMDFVEYVIVLMMTIISIFIHNHSLLLFLPYIDIIMMLFSSILSTS